MAEQVLAERYEIIEQIGQGGMGVVYKARHLLMKRIVAIKMLHEMLVASEIARKRFDQEVQAISALNHPNILTVYDSGVTEDGKPFLVVEFLEGLTLQELLDTSERLPVERAIPIFKQACSGLFEAHEKGIIHRDIKPSNFMLVKVGDQPDFLKILDFGIAKLVHEGAKDTVGLTVTGEVFGSPLYMSPEQCRGTTLDKRSDIYSLGCVMYRTLTGVSPFVAPDLPACLYKQVHEQPASFDEVCPELNLPKQLQDIVFKAMAKEPQDRYENMSEMRQALEDFEKGNAPVAEARTKAEAAAPDEQATSTPAPPATQQPAPQPTVVISSSVGSAGLQATNLTIGQGSIAGAGIPNQQMNSTVPPYVGATKPKMEMRKLVIPVAVVLALVAGIAFYFYWQSNSATLKVVQSLELGKASFQKGDYADAISQLNFVLQNGQKLPAGSTVVADATSLLYKAYFQDSKFDELTKLAIANQRYAFATAMLNDAVDSVAKKYGNNSPNLSVVYLDLAKLYEQQENYSQAEGYYAKALAIKGGKVGTPAKEEPAEAREIRSHLSEVTQKERIAKQRALLKKSQKPVVAKQTKQPSKPSPVSSGSAKGTSPDQNQTINGQTTGADAGDEAAPKKKRGVFGSVGHGLKKVFGVFGHHKKKGDTGDQ